MARWVATPALSLMGVDIDPDGRHRLILADFWLWAGVAFKAARDFAACARYGLLDAKELAPRHVRVARRGFYLQHSSHSGMCQPTLTGTRVIVSLPKISITFTATM